MIVIDVEIDKIDIPEDFPDDTPHDKDRMQRLAASIEMEGLHHPVGVCDNPNDPERKLLVYGRDRIRSFKALKRTTIPAHDHGVMADSDRIMAGLSENTMRKPGQKARYFEQLRRWLDLRNAKLGEGAPAPKDGRAIGSAAGVKARKAKAAARKAEAEQADAQQSEAEAEAVAPESPPAEATDEGADVASTAVIAETTGQTQRTVQHDTKIIKSFSQKAIEDMLLADVTKSAMLLVASKVSDPEKRKWAVTLLCAQMPVEEVIKTVLAPDVTVTPDGTKEVNEGDLTDEQWLEHTCGAKRALIANTAIYDQEALLYRHDRDDRHQYMNKAKKRVRKIKGGAHGLGPFSSLIYRLLWVAHPKDWPFCAGCAGKGEVTPEGGAKQTCTSCQGAGFHIKLEARS